MRTLPSIPYQGLTIILSQPSRFDTEHLLSGTAGDWFQSCLGSMPLAACDIRACPNEDALLEGTTKVLLLGEAAARLARSSCDPPGYPLIYQSRTALAAFHPQDCDDFRAMQDDDEDDDHAESDRDTKERSATRRKNYRFWTKWVTRKLLAGPEAYPKLDPIIYPRLAEATTLLLKTTNEDLYLDIETSRAYRNLSCIGFSTSSLWPRIYVVPVYLFGGRLAYSEYALFHRALSVALRRNTVVIHNSHFDLAVLSGYFNHLLPHKVYDTMIGQHRCFPEAEKSLAHAISCWTWLPYHKDEITDVYSPADEKRLWLYNAKDVYALKLIKDGQLKWASNDKGLQDSIAQGNASIIPYLVTTLTGLKLDTTQQAVTHSRLIREQDLFGRMCRILTGLPTFNPASTDQCRKFFHDTLQYPVMARTAKGAPQLGRKQLYQLLLKTANPVLPCIIRYRKAAKDASMLETELFEPPA